MSDKIPTAKEFLKKLDEELGTIWTEDDDSICKAFIEFAQLHVEAALKAAAKAENEYQKRNIFQHWSTETIILNAYPKTLIK